MRKLIAEWNSVRDVWELPQSAICGHSAAYSETWPTSGMTASGVAFELLTWERRTVGSAYLSSLTDKGLSPTPTSSGEAGAKVLPTPHCSMGGTMDVAHQMATRHSPGLESISGLLGTPRATEIMSGDLYYPKGGDSRFRLEAQISLLEGRTADSSKLLPTPDVSSGLRSPESHAKGDHQVSLQDLPHLLPTPDAYEAKRGGSAHPDIKRAGGHTINLADVTEHLLPTPTTNNAADRDTQHQMDTRDSPGLDCIPHLLPTTRAAMGETRNSNIYDRPGASNLENKVVSTGARMPQQLSGGNESLDDQHHDLLSLLAAMERTA